MLALNSGHTISHITAPDLIRLGYSKLAFQIIGDLNVFLRRLLIPMARLLTTDETKLFHQLCCPPAAKFYTFVRDHRGNITCACGAVTFAITFTNKTE